MEIWMQKLQVVDKLYLLVDDGMGVWVGALTETDHKEWLTGTLEVFQRTEDGRLFELTTCEPFVCPGCWEWAPVRASNQPA
jgi:hypothetical protein